MSEKKVKVFVYGTLRTGQGNYLRLLKNVEGVKKLCDDSIDGFTMYHLGGFPAIVPASKGKVTGESFLINSAVLERLDRLEGYTGDSSGLYDRQEILTEKNHKAFVYFMNKVYNNTTIIESGDWLNQGEK